MINGATSQVATEPTPALSARDKSWISPNQDVRLSESPMSLLLLAWNVAILSFSMLPRWRWRRTKSIRTIAKKDGDRLTALTACQGP